MLDTTSGFRAYNREAALQLIVVSRYTYTLESLIQAGKMSVALEDVPVSTNPTDRESRLAGSTSSYVRRNAYAIFRAYTLYEPLRVFMMLALVFGVLALAAWSPFLFDWILNGDRSGHIQSLILGAVLMLAAVQMFALGIIGDALAGQRAIAQRVYERVRRLELEAGVQPTHYERLAVDAPADRGDDRDDRRPMSVDDHRARRERLRQVRHLQPDRPAADGGVHVRPRRAGRADGRRRGARGRLRRGRALDPAGADAASGCAAPTPSRRCSRRRGGERAAAGVRDRLRGHPRRAARPRDRHAAELVVCCEVLEHLDDPKRALDVLARLARPWLIASVPREPLWRALNLARLSYVGALGNTPGHLTHWSKRGFERFLGERFEVVEVRTPLPWTMALCRVQSPPS